MSLIHACCIDDAQRVSCEIDVGWYTVSCAISLVGVAPHKALHHRGIPSTQRVNSASATGINLLHCTRCPFIYLLSCEGCTRQGHAHNLQQPCQPTGLSIIVAHPQILHRCMRAPRALCFALCSVCSLCVWLFLSLLWISGFPTTPSTIDGKRHREEITGY